MIDRPARDRVIAAFEDFLDDRITAFTFDERLSEIESEDATVNEVIHAVWFYYDDCKDHPVNLSKVQWDYFQRLLLILRSDAELSALSTSRWSWNHALAGLALGVYLGFAWKAGCGWQLLILAVPFGIVSMLIDVYRSRTDPEPGPSEIACTPFESFAQIRTLRSRVPGFRKRRYRPEIGGRTIRSEAEASIRLVLAYCYWLVFSPAVLLIQVLPSTDRCKVIVPR